MTAAAESERPRGRETPQAVQGTPGRIEFGAGAITYGPGEAAFGGRHNVHYGPPPPRTRDDEDW
jgi:hypothetical protein